MTYEILQFDGRGDAIKCLICGMVSYNPNDVEHRYCGNCHRFHLGPPSYSEALKQAKETLATIFPFMTDAALTRAAEGRVRMFYLDPKKEGDQ